MRSKWTVAILGAALALAVPEAPAWADGFARCSGQSDEPLVKLLPQPPCETCEKTKAELDELAGIVNGASEERKARAKEDLTMSIPQFLRGAGIPFDAGKLKACEDGLLKTQRTDEKTVMSAAKEAFCRTRPFNTSGNVLHIDATGLAANNDSYPSGHAAYGAAMGFVLASMLPEKRAEIYARIEDYAFSRLVLGVHFRSDVEAGKLIGAALGASLLSKPGVQAQFDEAKACVRQAVGLQ